MQTNQRYQNQAVTSFII